MEGQQIKRVRVEGLVLLKIIKHYQDEALTSQDGVNGILLGLSKGSELEVTNCFLLPKVPDDDPAAAENLSAFEMNMIRNLRQLNADYLNVGFYQSGSGGMFINRSNLETIYQYQSQISESVLLTYDASRTTRGQIGLKAYRLSADVLNAMLEAERRLRLSGNLKGLEIPWECEAAVSLGKNSFTRLLDEIPVVIHNSPLVTILLADLTSDQESSRSSLSQAPSMLDVAPPLPTGHAGRYSALDLSMASSLEQQLRSLLSGLDTVHDLQYLYQRNLSKTQGSNSTKESRNRELAPIRLDTALISAQLNFYCTGLSQMAGQTVGKLMLAQAVNRTSRHINAQSSGSQSTLHS